MKLSEAIKAGAKQMPQCERLLFDIDKNPTKCCALGAAYLGIELSLMNGDKSWRLIKAFPELQQLAICPECGAKNKTLFGVIGEHLNDTHRWTRERIADWLEGQEQ